VEAGLNTSTKALRVIEVDKKESLESRDSKIWSQVPEDSDPRMTALACEYWKLLKIESSNFLIKM
jgi:hypothetical protein